MIASDEIGAMSSREIAHAIFMEGRTRGEEMFHLLERLQAQDPVFHFAEADMWIATGNEEVRQILRSPAAEVGFAARNDHTQPGWREHHARADAKARANISEEVMRLVSAAPSSGRRTVRELEAGGRDIPRGSVVITILSAANRDPKVFPDPHRMDLLRERSSKAAGIGTGPHICLGQWFAKAAIGILFDELLDQCRIIEFDGPTHEPMGISMRQLPELLVKVA